MHDAALLASDENARATALDVSRSFIVQAPAGSGKTELLIQRYLHLLATVDDPEEILAITFTRKAAAEMQLRVLQALRRARDDSRPAESWQQATHDAAIAALARDTARGWNMLQQSRRMRIQTLDALNASIARTRPLTSTGGAAALRVAADTEMRRMYREAAVLTLDQLLEPGPLQVPTEHVLRHVDNNTKLYVDYLARMLATRDQWLPFIGSGFVEPANEAALRARFERNLAGAIGEHLQRTREAMPMAISEGIGELADFAARTLIETDQPDHPGCALSGITTVPDTDANALPQWQGLAELFLTKQGVLRRTVNKAQGFPAGTDERGSMLRLLEQAEGATGFAELLGVVKSLPQPAYSDNQWSVLLSLFRLLPVAVTELKRLFGAYSVTDYVEVALSAGGALGTADDPGEVALLLDYQIRHLLVDEMQDTSSAQYRLLEALTGGWSEGDGRTLFCVGDPMQSIYRFRNAEVGQFLLARETGIGGVVLEPLTLRRNFRSGENLVDWFNAVFPGVLARRDDAHQSAVSYSPAITVPSLAGQGACTVHTVFGSHDTAEADLGCEVIRQTLATDPDSDMAVLVRSRTRLPGLLSRLRQAGIAYRAVEIDRLTDLPEIIDVLALTRALVHRGDRLAWLALLRSPWAGLDWTDLHALVSLEPGTTVWQLLHDEDRLQRLSKPGRVVAERVLRVLAAEQQSGRVDTLRDRVERLWLQLGGPALLDDRHAVENVYRFLDVIEGMEVGGTLEDVAELEDALDAEHVSMEAEARLQVMTMHRAKGLQFDHVLLYGLGRTPGGQDRNVLNWFDVPAEHGGDEKVISPVGPRTAVENDPVHRFIEITEATKNRNEMARLLYVACTRARKSLHLLGHVEVSRDGDEIRAPRKNSLLRLLWPAVQSDFERAFHGSETPVGGNAEGWIMPRLRRFESSWTLPEPAPLPCPEPASEPAVEEVDFYWVGSEARVAGTLVHRWLQLAADGRIELPLQDDSARRSVSERWLAEAGVSGSSTAIIVERVLASLRGICADARGRWLLEGEGAAELALTGTHQDRVESVILDRVRVDDDGTHWIVDYKTSSHEGGDLNSFLSAESARYRPQLEKYAGLYRNYSGASVRCALYFPLLQEFVEVSV